MVLDPSMTVFDSAARSSEQLVCGLGTADWDANFSQTLAQAVGR